jgi:hypothetical protein
MDRHFDIACSLCGTQYHAEESHRELTHYQIFKPASRYSAVQRLLFLRSVTGSKSRRNSHYSASDC